MELAIPIRQGALASPRDEQAVYGSSTHTKLDLGISAHDRFLVTFIPGLLLLPSLLRCSTYSSFTPPCINQPLALASALRTASWHTLPPFTALFLHLPSPVSAVPVLRSKQPGILVLSQIAHLCTSLTHSLTHSLTALPPPPLCRQCSAPSCVLSSPGLGTRSCVQLRSHSLTHSLTALPPLCRHCCEPSGTPCSVELGMQCHV
eukprot:1160510-Pelagomonas_calceolata.AAC.5